MAGALIQAVLAGDLPAAERALRAGADPDARDPLGYPPLCLAAARGQVQMVELLLTAGADPLLPDRRMGATALHKAAQSGVADVARLLLDRGAFIDQQAPTHGHTALIDAVWHKRMSMVEFLLERGANPDLRAHGGYTASELEWAFGDDDFAPYREAIERTRELRRARDQDPLRLAALHGDTAKVREALDQGAPVNRMSVDGHTPLLDAAREGHADVVAVLLGGWG